MDSRQSELSFLQIPDVMLCLMTESTRPSCGSPGDVSGTMRVFEAAPPTRRCVGCQEHYLAMSDQERTHLRDLFLIQA